MHDDIRTARLARRALAVIALAATAAACTIRVEEAAPAVAPTTPSSTQASTVPATSAPLPPRPTKAPMPSTTPSTAPAPTAPPTAPPTAAPTAPPTAPPPTAPPPPPAPATTISPVLQSIAGKPQYDTADPASTSWVAGARAGDPVVTGNGSDCQPFFNAMGAAFVQQCGEWNAVGGKRIWTVVETGDARFFAAIWQQTAPGRWEIRLRLREEAPDEIDRIVIRAADVDTGPNQEMVTGVSYYIAGGFTAYDVVDIIGDTPTVVATAYGDFAQVVAKAGVSIWTGVYTADSGDCCPAWWDQHLLAFQPGRGWGLYTLETQAPLERVPATEF